jgi:UDP-2,4-diacetamido-2,4,6-trideoxy-beta-L-altropyranose hydrolase
MENKIRVYLRAEGNSQIGLGHIYRCLALAEYLRHDFNLHFIYSQNDLGVADLIPPYIDKIVIPFFDDYIDEANYIIQNILTGKEILVIDGYNFNTTYQTKVKQKGTRTVYIDDIHNFKIITDVVINHSGGLKKEDYDTDILTRLYLGPDYAILRKTFVEAAGQQKPEPNANKVFVSFGGADPHNYTLKILKEISQFKYQYNIVIGSAYLYEKELNEYIQLQEVNAKVYKNIDAELMKQLMQQSAKAITSASTVSYEYLACSAGTLYLIKTADNQQGIYQSLINQKLAFELKSFNGTHAPNTIRIFNNSLLHIIKIFTDLSLELLLTLRIAQTKDLDLYFNWANDPDVRKQSFNTELIKYDNHIVWFNNALSNNNILLLVFEMDNIPVAQIRFNIQNNKATINYSVDKSYRGKGIAKAVIKLGCEYVFKQYTHINIIEAQVKKDNFASKNVFLKNNFNITEESDKYIFTLSSIRHK